MLIWAGGQSAEGALAPVFIAAFVLVVFPLTEAFFPLSDAAASIPEYQDSLERMDGLQPPKGERGRCSAGTGGGCRFGRCHASL
ncbi:hypothetical protein PO124_15550 [Bacillus licheniformis]|nr:hypothetical protein [Bacillus licheniformis]